MPQALRMPTANPSTEYPIEDPLPARDEDAYVEYDDGLLAVAGPIMILCYTLFFSIAAITFYGTGMALFAVAISAFFGLIYFAIPLLMFRIRSTRDGRWQSDSAHAGSAEVDVWTGRMRRWEAIVQIVSIPLAILMGFTLLAIRWSAL